jgi:serine protease Do
MTFQTMLVVGVTFAFAMLLSLTQVAHAQDALPLEELEQLAFEDATRFVQDSVVQVETFGGAEIVNRQLTIQGPSSGTVLTADGWIVTSTFQFKGQPASITVVLPSKQRKSARLVARDFSRELALLKIDVDEPLKPATLSDRPGWMIGQWALAIGKTFDPSIGSCSAGILSAQGRIWDKAIQTDAKISPQNYGGPLSDLNGHVMGILTPINPGIVTEGEVEQWYDSGIGFAVPLADVLDRLPRMQKGEDIYPGKVGIRWRGEDEYNQPVVIDGVTPGSPASDAGLEVDDKILAVGPSLEKLKAIENHSQFKHAMGPLDAGGPFAVVVERQGQRKEFSCILTRELPSYREPYLGLLIDPASDPKNPKVNFVIPGSPAANAGITVGFIIESIDGKPFDDRRTLENRLANSNYRAPIQVGIRNAAGEPSSVKIELATRPEADLQWDYQPAAVAQAEKDQGALGAEAKQEVGTVQIPISDVQNKAFAIVPSNYSEKVPHGLLVIFGDAGNLNQSQWAEAWEPFAREHRWIIAVAQSSKENGWSFEEVEIGMRMQNWITRSYSIDRRRIAVGGLATGSILAYIAAAQYPEMFRGVWLSNPKLPQSIRINPSEPFKATSYFINGSDKSVDAFVDRIRKNGYTVQRQSSDLDVLKLVEAPLLAPVQRWLRLMEAY